MFKRIKNLLDISRYTVEELKQPSYHYTTSGYMHVDEDTLLSSTPHQEFKAATIISMTEVDPFKDFTDETPQQSPDDTTTGDK